MRIYYDILILSSTLVILLPLAGRTDDGPPVKRLIEFGWDEPDTAFLRRHIEEMERTPFDGCVFHVLAGGPEGKPENVTWLGWGRRAFTESELKPALADLKATPRRRFTHCVRRAGAGRAAARRDARRGSSALAPRRHRRRRPGTTGAGRVPSSGGPGR